MKKDKAKLLFVCYGLGIGGIEKCLVNLINALPDNLFDIDVLLMNQEQSSISQIKREVNFLDSFRYVINISDTITEIRRRGGFLKNLSKTASYCDFRIRIKLQLDSWRNFKSLPEHYDIAIAYSQNDASAYYVMDKVKADRKVMWFHNGAYEGNTKEFIRDKKYYSRFDFVVAVSNDCKTMLQKKFDFADGKLIVLRNICDAESVRSQAEMFIPQSFAERTYHIVTVGRMTKEKGADIVLECCDILRSQGKKFVWHWVGDGNMRVSVEKEIASRGLKDYLILEGNQINPYPYMKQANLYVQPSYYEAYSTTVTEAKILRKPMVVTDVGGMRDQIEDGVNGIIVPIDAEQIVAAVTSLMDFPQKASEFSQKLETEKFEPDDCLKDYYHTVLGEV